MKKMKTLSVLLLSLTCAAVSFGFEQSGPSYGEVELPKHEGSRQAHKKLTAEVVRMLRNSKYAEAKKFLLAIPVCPTKTVKKNELPDYCTAATGTDFKLEKFYFTREVDVVSVDEPGFVYKNYELTTVDRNVILTDALQTHYRLLMGNNPTQPGKFNKAQSVSFYNRYKNTWLKPLVEEAVLSWPRSAKTSLYAKEGEELYDRVSLALALNLNTAEHVGNGNYANSCDSMEELKEKVGGAWGQAVAMGDKKPFYVIKRQIFSDVFNPKRYTFLYWGDCRSFSFQRYISALGSENAKEAEEAWKLLVITPFNSEMKKNAQALYDFCWKNRNGYGKVPNDKVPMRKEWCTNFKKKAQAMGLIPLSNAEVSQDIRGHVRADASGAIWPSK